MVTGQSSHMKFGVFLSDWVDGTVKRSGCIGSTWQDSTGRCLETRRQQHKADVAQQWQLKVTKVPGACVGDDVRRKFARSRCMTTRNSGTRRRGAPSRHAEMRRAPLSEKTEETGAETPHCYMIRGHFLLDCSWHNSTP